MRSTARRVTDLSPTIVGLSQRSITSHGQETRTKRKVTIGISPAERRRATLRCHCRMEHSELLDIVMRPLSPDTRLEVPASRAEYERVEEMFEREETK
ncbi:hypothetical protein POJ06DRAFT_248133 [Lipomyces tetrasporus]|uniref:Uncharacterized protein n=1 Tax=Lipomyces tetrasporus TaxID=54092 RepID=A0AAD7VV55_9ASCO|nr:uncharacterized protein POJ06DRAFT_248133 [Lipomyces tetrasporus]KAJ8101875.1 hypothetical protein POJ06DRAFT_248133 [Lipomyces tetrasporus]